MHLEFAIIAASCIEIPWWVYLQKKKQISANQESIIEKGQSLDFIVSSISHTRFIKK